MPDNYQLKGRHSRIASLQRVPADIRFLDDDDNDDMNTPRTSNDSAIGELQPLKEDLYKDELPSPRPAFFEDKYGLGRRRPSSWRRYLVPSRTCLCVMLLFTVAVLALLSAGGFWAYKVGGIPPDGQSDPWYPAPRGGTVREWQESYKKAAALVDQMTLVEKVNLTTGTGWMMDMCVGMTGPVDRLNFPALCLQDGPLGIRFADNITAFPGGVTMGATWNKELMYQKGRAQGVEARLKGIHVMLGPSVGPLGRLPGGGRNWEGFGADPVLQAFAAALTVEGIQDEGVMATIKHFVANEQEHFRQSWEWGTPNAISSNIDDRTMHEIYAWPFADAIRAGVASVMCSYNQVNNSYACQNSKLLNGIIKDEMGFQGFIQSDWLAQRSGVASALAGLDMSMPGDGLLWQDGKSLWGTELTKAVLNGTVPVERVHDMALRIVAAWYQMGQDDESYWARGNNSGPNFSSWTWNATGLLHPGSDDKAIGVVNKFVDARQDHHRLAYEVAAEGIVLVKNEGNLLPFPTNGFDVTHDSTRKLKVGLYGEDGYHNPAGDNACPDRACNVGHLAMAWGSGAVEFSYLVAPADALHADFDPDSVDITDEPTNSPDLSSAIPQDICIVFINSDAGEGYVSWENVKGDRPGLYPQKDGDKLVQDVAKSCGGGNAPVIVVVHAVGPVILEKWIEIPNVMAVLLAHLGGQESGHALADVIFGKFNPSGRLPYTIAKSEDDYGPTSKILTKTTKLVPQQNFTERMYFDYRYFDAQKIEPRYEFGYGLSYSEFRISSVVATSLVLGRQPLPARREQGIDPPQLDRRIPQARDSVYPDNFRKLKKYVYPYINSVDDAKPGDRYPYPRGYEMIRGPSQAGGAQGGNPDLFTALVILKADVENLSKRAGACVTQLYVTFPDNMMNSLNETIDMPPRLLRKFERVILAGSGQEGARQTVGMELTRRDLSFWDIGLQNWVLPPGTFWLNVGQSSRKFDDGAYASVTF